MSFRDEENASAHHGHMFILTPAPSRDVTFLFFSSWKERPRHKGTALWWSRNRCFGKDKTRRLVETSGSRSGEQCLP